jgi:hypothetical protein
MKNHNRYAESRGPENLGDKMDKAMTKKYGKHKDIPAFINAKEGRDADGKEQSISYGNSGEDYEE